MKHTIPFFLIFLTFQLFGQHEIDAHYGLIFQIDANRCAALLSGEISDIAFLENQTATDTFRTDASLYALPHGHYVVVKAANDYLHWEIFSHNRYSLWLHDDSRQLNVAVVDAAGQTVAAENIYIEKRQLRFDEENHLYSSRCIKGGLLTVNMADDTMFYEVKTDLDRSVVVRRIGYFSRTKVGYVVLTPYRWGRSAYQYVRRVIKWGEWRIYNWPFKKLYHRLFGEKNLKFRGYIATQQPRYRPGDTLLLSANLAHTKGRPFRKPVHLRINAQNETWLDTILAPNSPGQYDLQWPLSDSLPLDVTYRIEFRHDRGRRTYTQRHQFRMEDYELDEFQFGTMPIQERFAVDEVPFFDFKAEDTNGLPVLATTVKGQILVEKIEQIFTDSLSVPDTLWQFQEEFSDEAIMSLHPPDSIWPIAHTRAILEVSFQSPSGETHFERHAFVVERPAFIPTIKLEDDSLVLRAFASRTEVSEIGTFLYFTQKDTLQKIEINSGQKVPIHPLMTHGEWQVRDEKNKLYLGSEEELVAIYADWQSDTVTLSWQNPRALPIHWILSDNDSPIRTETCEQTSIIRIPVNHHKRQLWLRYSYPWAGNSEHESQDIKWIDQQLDITMEAPERIYPGETASLTTTVEDVRGKGVEGAVVTQGAYNAQFQQDTPLSVSDIAYRGRRKPFHRQSYNIHIPQKERTVNLSSTWYQRFGLQRFLEYRLLFPPKEGLLEYADLHSADTLAQQTAQFAPWMVKNRHLQNVFLVYLDNRLVYYHEAWQQTPYSIVAKPGYHNISVRTRDASYSMDSVFLEAGKRLDLSINADDFDQERILYSSKPAQLTSSERSNLAARSFFIHTKKNITDKQFFHQNNGQLFYFNQPQRRYAETVIPIGLFDAETAITRLRPGTDTINFKFEPSFAYDIRTDRDRLYEHTPYDRKKYYLNHRVHYPIIGQEAIFPADIKLKPVHFYLRFDDYPEGFSLQRGRLQVLFKRFVSAKQGALIVMKDDEPAYLLPINGGPIALPEGNYSLVVYDESEHVWRKDVIIKNRQYQALRFDSLQWQQQAISENLVKFIKGKRILSKPNPFPQAQKLPSTYYGVGRLISGHIYDTEGEPLIGASILIQGTVIGTITDIDGYYELWAPYDAGEVIVSYTGFKTQQTALGNSNVIDIALDEGSMMLDEVIVIGYGVQKKQQDSTISIRGSRSGANTYYVDGMRVRSVSALASTTSGVMLTGGEVQPGAVSSVSLRDAEFEIPIDTLRERFRDYGYWQTGLLTNKKGEVDFEVTFPDDITNWRHFAVGADRKNRIGIGAAYTKSYLPLQAQLYTPRFLVEGDQGSAIGVLTNRTIDTLNVEHWWTIDGQISAKQNLLLEASSRSVQPLPQVLGLDSLWIRYQLQADVYKDGEERPIPVFQKGVERSIGGYLVLNDDQIKSFDIQADKGLVTMRASGNQIPLLLDELATLRKYPHECNEQMASKIIALLLTEKAAGLLEEEVKTAAEIRRLIRKLDRSRQNDGAWGWWPGSTQSSAWITQHVLRAWAKASMAGYSTPDITGAERFLLHELPSLERRDQLDLLLFLAERGQILDYEPYLDSLHNFSTSFEERLPFEMGLIRLRQLSKQPYTLDTLLNYQQKTMTGGHYWGVQNTWWYRHFSQTTRLSLLAYQLYKTAGDSAEMNAIQQYFLEPDFARPNKPRSHQIGRNTYEKSLLLNEILTDQIGTNDQFDKLEVELVQPNDNEVTEASLSESMVFTPEAVDEMQVRKTGDGPAFVAYSQSYWDETPQPEDNGLALHTQLYQNDRQVKNLEVSKPATLATTITVSADAEYVMLELPVPAGCTYGDKIFRENRYETHREYRRNKVVVFCERMPKGNYTFNINLSPRYPGVYHINAAKAEMMYVPSFNGIGEGSDVEID